MNQNVVKFHEMRSTICHVSPVPLVNPTHAVRPLVLNTVSQGASSNHVRVICSTLL